MHELHGQAEQNHPPRQWTRADELISLFANHQCTLRLFVKAVPSHGVTTDREHCHQVPKPLGQLQ
eukprot:5982538-Amphidinium_carterae.1